MKNVLTNLVLMLHISILFNVSLALAAEVYIPPIQARSGSEILVPIMIDRVDNLAGVKLVLNYDPKLLQFRSVLSVMDLETKNIVYSLTGDDGLKLGPEDIEFSADGRKAYVSHATQEYGGVSFLTIERK